MPHLRVTLAIAAFLLALTPAMAEVRILSSPGGTISGYLDFFAQVRQSGQRIVIDGPCLSACTLVLSTVPRNRICVTQRAVLGFHAPQLIAPNGQELLSRNATRAVFASYPQGVREWIGRHGGLTQRVIFLRGPALTRLFRRC